jgi:hypothetical protein
MPFEAYAGVGFGVIVVAGIYCLWLSSLPEDKVPRAFRRFSYLLTHKWLRGIALTVICVGLYGAASNLLDVIATRGPTSAWTTFTSVDGRFSASFPGPPTHTSKPPPTAGAGAVQIDTWRSSDKQSIYHVSYVDFPSGSLSNQDPKIAFDRSQSGVIADFTKGTLITSLDIRVDGHPGREFTFSTSNGVIITERICLVGDRLYNWVGLSAQPTNGNTFLHSFRLTSP